MQLLFSFTFFLANNFQFELNWDNFLQLSILLKSDNK